MMLSPYNTVAVVQFTREVYSVPEEEGSVSVCVVLSGTEVQVGNFLEIGYHTGDGTASGKVYTNAVHNYKYIHRECSSIIINYYRGYM